MTYDQADRRTATVLPNLLTPNNSFDLASDLTQIPYLSGGSYSGGVCSPGSGNGAGTGTGTLTYSFDQSGRQVGRDGSIFTQVTPPTVAAGSVSFNADNQLTTWNSLDNIYDDNGNLTCTGSTSTSSCTGSQSQAFAWDVRNRMTQAAAAPGLGGNAESYVYDGLNRRQSIGVAASTTLASTLYDGLNPVWIGTVNTASGSTTDINKVFGGLELDERFKLSDPAASATTSTMVTDIQGSAVMLKSGGRPRSTTAATRPSAAQAYRTQTTQTCLAIHV